MRKLDHVLAVTVITLAGVCIAFGTISDRKTEVRDIRDFTGVDIGNTITADILAGQEFKVVIEADEEVLPHVVTKVSKNSLHVEFEKDWWRQENRKHRDTKVHVTISLPFLNDVDVSGASRANVTGVSTDFLKIDVSGASDVSIDGTARRIDIDLSGASNLRADSLYTETAKMDLSGASSVRISVSNELSVDASGASSVVYKGSPRVRKETSGASSVVSGN